MAKKKKSRSSSSSPISHASQQSDVAPGALNPTFTDVKKAKFFISALEHRVRDFLRNKVDWDRPHEVDALQVYQWADQCVDEINREERGSKARESDDTVMVAAQHQAQKKKKPWFRFKKGQNRQQGNRDKAMAATENTKQAA